MTGNAPPKVFISATSADLHSVRLLVKDALLKIGCHPVDQEDFPPDWRSVEKLLHDKVDDCAALVHIAGLRHGYGPDPTTLPLGLPRSYTQLEYDHGCRLQHERGDTRFRVYVFVCPEDFDYDTGSDPESAETQSLQHAHRAALLADPRRYEQPATPQVLKERVLALREPVLALQREQAAVQKDVRRSHGVLLFVLALVALLVIGGPVAYVHVSSRIDTGIATLSDALTIDAPRIKTHLREASERKLAADLAAAEKEATSEARERQREAAKAAHEMRLLRIDDVVASFAALTGQADVDPIVRETGRILQEEGVEQALAYAERQRPDILKAVDAAQAAHQEKIRAQLQPLLNAAQLQAVRGDDEAVRRAYTELSARQPEWPDLLQALGWYLYGRSNHAREHGSLRAAQSDAAVCLDLASRWQRLAPDSLPALKLLGAANVVVGDGFSQSGRNGATDDALKHYQAALAHSETRYKASPDDADAARDLFVNLNKLGNFLAVRGQSGDAPQVLSYYQRGLEISERLFAANPGGAEAASDLSVSFNKLGDFLATRGQFGDAPQALSYYRRGLEMRERLLAANPNSAEAARDVSVSLDDIGDFLAARGQSNDAPQALSSYRRGLEIRERLLMANPDSVQAARDVSVSLDRLGEFLSARGQSGDAPQALSYYRRGLETRERLLAANPDSAQATRDVSVSLDNLGEFLAARGQSSDAPQALNYFQRGLETRERLLADNPDNAQAARDVFVSLNKLGNFLAVRGQSGDAPQALTYYQRALEISERLLEANPDSAQAARDVSVSLNKLGDSLAPRGQSGDAPQALSYYRRGLETRERLLAANPDSARAAHDVLVSLERLAEVEGNRIGRAKQALALQTRALDLGRSLRVRNPDSAYYGHTLAASLLLAARYAQAAGEEELALQHLAACLATLEALVEAGVELDAPMSRLHTYLKNSPISP